MNRCRIVAALAALVVGGLPLCATAQGAGPEKTPAPESRPQPADPTPMADDKKPDPEAGQTESNTPADTSSDASAKDPAKADPGGTKKAGNDQTDAGKEHDSR